MELIRPLPRGRHGLSREDVAESQRDRLQRAAIELVAEHGFPATTVQQIVAAASVSRQTFYELYRSKEECYEAGLFRFTASMAGTPMGVSDEGGEPFDRLERILREMFTRLAADPPLAHCLLFEASGSASSRTGHATALRPRFVAALSAALGGGDDFAVHGFTAMTRQLLEEHVAAGRFDELQDLAGEILQLVRRHAADVVH